MINKIMSIITLFTNDIMNTFKYMFYYPDRLVQNPIFLFIFISIIIFILSGLSLLVLNIIKFFKNNNAESIEDNLNQKPLTPVKTYQFVLLIILFTAIVYSICN